MKGLFIPPDFYSLLFSPFICSLFTFFSFDFFLPYFNFYDEQEVRFSPDQREVKFHRVQTPDAREILKNERLMV